MANLNELIIEIESSDSFNLDRGFEITQICSFLLNNNELEGRTLIINILNNWKKFPVSITPILTDLIESAGFYPYLQKNIDRIQLNNLPAEIRNKIHLSSFLTEKYFHDEQYDILKLLKSGINVIVSAPTSFGKSLLIEEVVASRQYRNIVVVQPTLALLDETRKKLLKYKNSYKLIVRTSQEPSVEKGNIILFTAERVNEYQLFPAVDFLVIDEFYKLSGKRDDERSSSLNNAFYHLLKSYLPKFYLLGPNIDGISPGFTERYNAIFYKSNYSLVDSREINMYEKHKGEFGPRSEKKEYKESVLFELLTELENEQSIIYCSSPQRVRYLSKKFTNFLIRSNISESKEKYPLMEWIEKNIANDWSLLINLKYNIGIHDGALQKHISTSIIDYFNNGKLKYLFCTSTIIEGVNTSAKNIIYFDSKKGPNPVDFFDYSNIKGRAGRMMEHYVGRIFNFNKPPEYTPIIIDIPFFQQNPIKDEVLIQLNDVEVKDKTTEQYKAIESLPTEEKKIIKKNGISVHGQKSIFDILRNDIHENYELIEWNIPKYKQLEYILGLAWDNLIIEGESISPMTKKRLIKLTFDYGNSHNIYSLVKNNYDYYRGLEANINVSNSDLKDQAIQDTFQIMKHWFEYKVPKWLSVLNEIQRFICSEFGMRPGNYVYYANMIENDFLRDNLSILAEYGVPSTAIHKIEKKIPESINQDELLDFIRINKIYETKELIEYEIIKLKENISWTNNGDK